MGMNYKELKERGLIIFECIAGSKAYGTNIPTSDTDIRYKADHDAPMQHSIWGCDTAEVMIWDEAGRFAKHTGGSLFESAPWSDELDEYDFEWCNTVQGGHNDQVFGHCSSECVAKMIGTLSSCGDEDPRRSIAQIYNAQG